MLISLKCLKSPNEGFTEKVPNNVVRVFVWLLFESGAFSCLGTFYCYNLENKGNLFLK